MRYAVILSVALTWGMFMPAHFWAQARGRKALSLTVKVVPTMAAAAFASLARGADAYSAWLLAGLCVCALADVMLGVRFEVGGALFFAGHLLYLTALSFNQAPSVWSAAVFAVAWAGLWAFSARYRDLMPRKRLMAGVMVYAMALAALLAMSVPAAFAAPSRRTVLAACGASLFVLSDVTLCHNLLRHKPALWQYFSLGAYYMAQLLLGLSAPLA